MFIYFIYMSYYRFAFLFLSLSCVFSFKEKTLFLEEEIETAKYVDLSKYLGVWYEIYRLPNSFEPKGCYNVKANYSIKKNGDISVLNSCIKKNGKEKKAKGIAKVVDKKTNSKLKVSFFGPFYGDYWIIDIDENYKWAIISDRNRKYLWILSREKEISEVLNLELLKKIEKLGFKKESLIKTIQK